MPINKQGRDMRFTVRKKEINYGNNELGVELYKTYTKKTIFNKFQCLPNVYNKIEKKEHSNTTCTRFNGSKRNDLTKF